MVGKPNVSKNATQGASMTTPGLSPLDQEREASMADEGGAAGAEMERQELPKSQAAQSMRIPAKEKLKSNQPKIAEIWNKLSVPHVTLRQHNIMDYVHGATVAASPFIFRFSHVKPAAIAFTALGTGTIGYSLFTRYPYSIAKVIPLGVHMCLDLASGAAIAGAPYALGYKNRLNKFQLGLHFMLGLGAFALVALTRPKTENQKMEEWADQLEDKFKLAA